MEKFIIKLNDMVKHMFKNKIFLIHIVIAIIITTLGIMSDLNETQLAILILTIASSLRGSVNYSLASKKKKISSGAMLLFNALCASIIGYLIFIKINNISLELLYNKIYNSQTNILLLILIIAPIISIIAKIITKNGEPLYGGIISGHGAFVSTVLVLSLNYNFLIFIFLILPALSIILPRCMNLKNKILKEILYGSSITTAIIAIIISTSQKLNLILITAIALIFCLTILAQQGEKVHKKYEVCLGILTGTISTILILIMFQNFQIL